MRRLAILAAGFLAAVGLSPVLPAANASAGCGRLDMPETGVAGQVPRFDQLSGRARQGYNCGVAVVGYNSLGQRGSNGNMAWSGDCAYVTGDGIAVIDVKDPTNPRHVGTLHGPGSDATIETISAVDVGNRHLLAAGRYGLLPLGQEAPVDFYDTTDCAHPRFLSTLMFPQNVHNLTITADGNRLFSTLPLQAADITNPRKPKMIGQLQPELLALKVHHNQYAHEAWPSPDGHWLYIGGQNAAEGLNPELLILDIRNWPRRPLSVVGRVRMPAHSIRPMTINGKAYLMNADESVVSPTAKGCLPSALTPFAGAAQPYITDISNAHKPHAVSQFRLAINEPQNCAQSIADLTANSVHYHDVDDPYRTTFALLSMWNSGMRIVDVRDPLHPTEVAYFNPGKYPVKRPPRARPLKNPVGALAALQEMTGLDQAWAHSRYNPATGLIWLTTQTGGFWVLELEPHIRSLLGLPAKPAYHPRGTKPRPASSQFAPKSASKASALYCTVGPLVAAKLAR